ncbi:MAG TPA: AAA family ATPase [Vicinamibacterales bacterium]|nr:AAA family ATPase [Vicinamibacterales bacterium]
MGEPNSAMQAAVIVFEPFRLDHLNQCLWSDGTRIGLKPKPFAVLQYLIARADRLVTQDEILTAIWPETYVQPEVIRQHILEIRRALGDSANAPRFIRTFPKRGYQFIAPVSRDGARVADRESDPRFVGRRRALDDLQAALKRAQLGRRQVIFVAGEAGIGKTSLMDAFQHAAESTPDVHVARGHSLEGFGGKETHYPILEALGQLVHGPAGGVVANTLATHAPTWLIRFRSLVSAQRRAMLHEETIGATPERMVREICEALEAMAQIDTVVLVLEDLHWADHSTLDVVSAIARRRETARLLVIGTLRPADANVSESPLKGLRHDLVVHQLAADVKLERLSARDVALYVSERFAGSDLPEGLAAVIHRHSDGNPLFMTAIVDHLVQSHIVIHGNDGWGVRGSVDHLAPGVPDTVRQMVETLLRQLSIADRRLLGCASVAGQRFTTRAIAAMLVQDESDVEAQCEALAQGQQFVRACGTLTLQNGESTVELEFSHGLYREVLHRRLNHSERVMFERRLAGDLERVHALL